VTFWRGPARLHQHERQHAASTRRTGFRLRLGAFTWRWAAPSPGPAFRRAFPEDCAGLAGRRTTTLTSSLGLDLHDVTVSDATADDLLQPFAAPAQLDAPPPTGALIAITAGAATSASRPSVLG
jgi:hypothetical protein